MLRNLREPVHPSIQAFPPIEVDQLAREQELSAKAETAGKRDRPASNETSPDSVELDILSEVEHRARKGSEDYRSQLELYEGRIRRALVSSDLRVMIEAAGRNALTDYVAQTTDDINHLHNDRAELEGRARELGEFKKANGLRRPPRVVEFRQKVVLVLFLAIFVIVESMLNGLFFAKGSEGGVIGGVTWALGLSLLNIGGAVMYALLGMGQLRRSHTTWRVIGILATVAYIAWVLLLNLAIAHFRDLFALNEGQVMMDDLAKQLSATPFRLAEAQSWLLGILGIALSILALIDAKALTDPYPGYGELGHRYKLAVQSFADHVSGCLNGLQSRRDLAVGDMSEVVEKMHSSEYDLRLAVEGRERLHRDFTAYLEHLSGVYQQLVRHYREANQAARSTDDPAYFRSTPMRPAFLNAPALPEMPELATDVRSVVVARMGYYIGQVNAEFETALGRYKTVAEAAVGADESAAT